MSRYHRSCFMISFVMNQWVLTSWHDPTSNIKVLNSGGRLGGSQHHPGEHGSLPPSHGLSLLGRTVWSGQGRRQGVDQKPLETAVMFRWQQGNRKSYWKKMLDHLYQGRILPRESTENTGQSEARSVNNACSVLSVLRWHGAIRKDLCHKDTDPSQAK